MASFARSFNIVQILKLAGLATLVLLGALILIIAVFGIYQTYRSEHNPKNTVFRGGGMPNPLPDGPYRGSYDGKTSWQGKTFDKEAGTGINQFSDGQRYRFKTYPAKGLRDPETEVLRIDYDQPGNPLWLRFIVDEIVQVGDDKYQGKVHLKILPGVTFTLAYFELRR